MAGHSHSSNIWGTKSAQDAKRSKLFTRLSKDIVNAVKIGKSIDSDLNPLLRSALDKAKAANIPSDKVQNAIDKASGKSEDRDVTQNKMYEVLSSNGKYILVEAETDNPTRTFAEVKLIVSRCSFKMLEVGSALRFFEEVGQVILSLKNISFEKLVDNIISTSGIIDYIQEFDGVKFYVQKENFRDLLLEVSSWTVVDILSASLVYKNNLNPEFNKSDLDSILEFENKITELQDVVAIWWK